MIDRRNLLRGAAVGLVALELGGCSILPSFGSGRSRTEYRGTGKRIPVLATNELEPAAALQGVDFAIPEAQPRTDWLLPGGTPEQSVEHVAAAPDFEIAWRRSVGTGGSRRFHVTATPVAADGRIYVMDARAGVSARNAQDGAQIWRTDLAPRTGRDRESFGGGIALGGGLLYVSSGFRFMTALDANTGEAKWRTAVPSPLRGAPTVHEGRVFAVDVENQLFVFDAATGEIVWNYQALEEPARILAASSPAISGDVVVVPFASGEVVAMRAPNGTMLWNDTLSLTNRNNALSEIRDVAGRPVIYRGDVFAGSHSGLAAAISLRDGQRRWELPVTTITTPLPAGDVVYITEQSGQVLCVSRENGLIYWRVNLNEGIEKAKNRAVWSSPLLASNRLILVSNRGQALALNPKNGERLKTLRLGSGAFVSPIAVGGMVYVITDGAELVAIR